MLAARQQHACAGGAPALSGRNPRTRPPSPLYTHITPLPHTQINKATLGLLKRVEPYIAWGYPNEKSVRELIYKRGFGKVDGNRIPLTDNKIIEQVGTGGVVGGCEWGGIWRARLSRRGAVGCGQLCGSGGGGSVSSLWSSSSGNRRSRLVGKHLPRLVWLACSSVPCMCCPPSTLSPRLFPPHPLLPALQVLGKQNIICIEDLVHEIYTVGPAFKEASNFLWPFKLNSPRGGLDKKRLHYVEGGQAGNREAKINALLRRMN